MLFDNRRILHGRGFVQSDVPRFVQGCYVNRDGLWYQFAKAQRVLEEDAKFNLVEHAFAAAEEKNGVGGCFCSSRCSGHADFIRG